MSIVIPARQPLGKQERSLQQHYLVIENTLAERKVSMGTENKP